MQLPNVAMIVEESVHYSILDKEAQLEWLYNSPPGTGSVRLGAENRTFFVSMFHELHCLRGLRASLAGDEGIFDSSHMHHCFNYLRQLILCQADLTLEPGDFETRDLHQSLMGSTHICKDWETIYAYLTVNWDDWMISQDRHK